MQSPSKKSGKSLWKYSKNCVEKGVPGLMAYFDNAATTYPKPECVYRMMDEFYRNNGGSAGRSNHSFSIATDNTVAETRKEIQKLLHCPAKQVIFEPTNTIALNMIIQGIVENGARNIYISPFEHNAVTRTLTGIAKKVSLNVIKLAVDSTLHYDLEQIRYQFESTHPDFVIVSHASNVIGLIAPVEEIFILAKKYRAITLIDMAQTAGLVDCNIGLDIFDFATFSGHKTMLGPTGISGFIMKPEIELPPILFGGTGFESANQDMPESLPERYEMGTLNTVGIAGLHASINWILEKSVDFLLKEEQEKRRTLLSLLQEYEFIKVVGNRPGDDFVGIVSCLIQGISSDSAGQIFSNNNIAVRTGLQCAPSAHHFLKTFPAGTIRFSVNTFTSDTDFEELRDALEFISDNL